MSSYGGCGYCNRCNTYVDEIVCDEDLKEDIFDISLTQDYAFCKYKECEECDWFEEE